VCVAAVDFFYCGGAYGGYNRKMPYSPFKRNTPILFLAIPIFVLAGAMVFPSLAEAANPTVDSISHAPAGNPPAGTVTFTATASDADGDLQKVTIYVDENNDGDYADPGEQTVCTTPPSPCSVTRTYVAGQFIKYYAGARDVAGNLEFSAIPAGTFTLGPPLLPAPNLLSPTNNFTVLTTTPALVWGAVPGAVNYMPNISAIWSPAGGSGGATSIVVPAGILSPGGTYTWNVRACSDVACFAIHPWSVSWTFKVSAGGIDSLTHSPDPVFETTPTVTFTATASAVAPATIQNIRIQVDINDDGGAPEFTFNCPVSPCTGTAGPFAPGIPVSYDAQLTDSLGNLSPVVSNSFGVLSVGGNITIGAISPTSAIEGSVRTFTAPVSVAGGNPGVTSCEFRGTSGLLGPMSLSTIPCTNCTTSINYTFPSDGSFVVWARCTNGVETQNGLGVTINVADVGGGPTTVPIGPIAFPNPLGATSFTDLVKNIIDFLFTMAVIVAPVLLVIAGVIFMTAAGDPSRVSTARRMLLWTVIGFGIILISKGLVEVLRAILGI